MKNNIELISVLFKYGRTTPHNISQVWGGWEILSDGWGQHGHAFLDHCMGWSQLLLSVVQSGHTAWAGICSR